MTKRGGVAASPNWIRHSSWSRAVIFCNLASFQPLCWAAWRRRARTGLSIFSGRYSILPSLEMVITPISPM